MTTILGLNAYHGDSSACLVRDGKLVAAAEEERFRRVKHWAGLPTQAIQYCLAEAGLRLGDLDHVAINRDPRSNNFRRAAYVIARRPSFKLILNRMRNIRHAAGIDRLLAQAFPGQTLQATVHHIEHHLAHLASAFHVAPFSEAVCVSVDGFGDFASCAWGLGQRNVIRIDGRVYFPHSLGIFYSAITQYLGFPHYGDEYKVMGLAPYGEPHHLEEMRQLVRVRRDGTFRLGLEYFRHHKENVSYSWNDCAPEVGPLYNEELERMLGAPARKRGDPLEQRHKDLARSAQAMYEEAFFALLNSIHAQYRRPNLALAGGCAMNSVANGKICTHSPFKALYLPAAAGDAGGAIGAAFVVWHQLRPVTERFYMEQAYWGPKFDGPALDALLEARREELKQARCTVKRFADVDQLCHHAAKAVSLGQVIGWFQGRMEWGPRALGNRSILCDPRRPDMKEILNAKIKRRESFRPFAPSILREAVRDWFEIDDDVPFMMQVFPVRRERRAVIPAVTHVDGSGRLHTVTRSANPMYYNLISRFQEISGVPLVLNTSFNENEPVVCRPEEALECFLRTKMDGLALGNHFISRETVA
jgi:carbamoyltransferase